MLYLGSLFYVMLLSLNAVCILNKDRFLVRIGLSNDQLSQGVSSQVATLVQSLKTVLTIPLIACNIIVILYELILG